MQKKVDKVSNKTSYKEERQREKKPSEKKRKKMANVYCLNYSGTRLLSTEA